MFLDINIDFVNAKGKVIFVELPFLHEKQSNFLKKSLQSKFKDQNQYQFYVEENPFLDLLMPETELSKLKTVFDYQFDN
jgi:hypothetical protein